MTTQWQLVDIETKEIMATLEEPFPVLPSVLGETPETLETFLIKYTLNRASTSNNLDGANAANEAIKAWDTIQKIVKRDKHACT